MSRCALPVLLCLLAACQPTDLAPPPSLSRALGSDQVDAGFARAEAPALLQFPRDHGPHAGFRNEWWYVTANLRDTAGRRFGVELALFRFALRPGDTRIDPRWDSPQVFLVHAALSDVDGGGFHYLERASRPALALAGAEGQPFRAWVGDCEARSLASAGTDAMPMRIRCGDSGFGYELTLRTTRPPVLHGEQGLSRKSDQPGSASYYYSYPFLDASGSVRAGSDTFVVEGAAWLDHEWGSSVLTRGQAGWDWFSLRLDDGSALMLFRIRDASQRPVAVRGTFIDPGGAAHPFVDGELQATPRESWRSPHSGAHYPLEWSITSPRFALSLTVHPQLHDQELRTSVRYWEGAISATGTRANRPVSGEGYLELTGY